MTAVALAPNAVDSLKAGSPGFSGPAGVVQKWLSDARRHARETASDWRTLSKTLVHGLREQSASQEDNESALALDPIAERFAMLFLDALPIQLPVPDVVLDSDGEVSFDWWFAPHAQLSISVGPTGNLTYASLIGPGVERHGVEPFKDTIPKVLLDTLGELAERFGSPK